MLCRDFSCRLQSPLSVVLELLDPLLRKTPSRETPFFFSGGRLGRETVVGGDKCLNASEVFIPSGQPLPSRYALQGLYLALRQRHSLDTLIQQNHLPLALIGVVITKIRAYGGLRNPPSLLRTPRPVTSDKLDNWDSPAQHERNAH